MSEIRTTGLVSIGAVWLLCGCASQPTSRSPPQPDLLLFLDGEHVTRADVTAHLGPASATFDRDGVVTYRLSQVKAGYVVAPPPPAGAAADWQGIDYDLVLAFDEAGVLSAHNLVAIHAPLPKP